MGALDLRMSQRQHCGLLCEAPAKNAIYHTEPKEVHHQRTPSRNSPGVRFESMVPTYSSSTLAPNAFARTCSVPSVIDRTSICVTPLWREQLGKRNPRTTIAFGAQHTPYPIKPPRPAKPEPKLVSETREKNVPRAVFGSDRHSALFV